MFLIISRQIIKMFLLMMVAFITFRAKVIDHEGSRTISNLVLMVVTPMLILKAFLQEATPQLVRGLGLALLFRRLGGDLLFLRDRSSFHAFSSRPGKARTIRSNSFPSSIPTADLSASL